MKQFSQVHRKQAARNEYPNIHKFLRQYSSEYDDWDDLMGMAVLNQNEQKFSFHLYFVSIKNNNRNFFSSPHLSRATNKVKRISHMLIPS